MRPCASLAKPALARVSGKSGGFFTPIGKSVRTEVEVLQPYRGEASLRLLRTKVGGLWGLSGEASIRTALTGPLPADLPGPRKASIGAGSGEKWRVIAAYWKERRSTEVGGFRWLLEGERASAP